MGKLMILEQGRGCQENDRLLNIESQLSVYLRAYVCGTFTFEQAPDSKNENK